MPDWHEIRAGGGHTACNEVPNQSGAGMLHSLAVALFAMACGFTASGITANLYRLIAGKPEDLSGKAIYAAIMIFAGPSVLFGNAASKFRKKSCSGWAFWFAAAVSGYWSFAIGLFVLSLSLSL